MEMPSEEKVRVWEEEGCSDECEQEEPADPVGECSIVEDDPGPEDPVPGD